MAQAATDAGMDEEAQRAFDAVLAVPTLPAPPAAGRSSGSSGWPAMRAAPPCSSCSTRPSRSPRQPTVWLLGVLHNQSTRVHRATGAIGEAERALERSIEVKQRVNDEHGIANPLANLAGLARDRGEAHDAERLLEGTLTSLSAPGPSPRPSSTPATPSPARAA